MASTPTFMGLPPELRVRIYEFAFVPHGGFAYCFGSTRQYQGHCCVRRSRMLQLGGSREYGTRATALLRVNRQIHQEALPILCKQLELRIPYTGTGTFGCHEPVRSLPTYQRQHIRKLLIIQFHEDAIAWLMATDRSRLGSCWEVLRRELPHLQDLRVHLDIGGKDLVKLKQKSDAAAFLNIGELEHLRRLEFEVHQSFGDMYPNKWSEALIKEAEEQVRSRLVWLLGDKSEVIVSIRARERVMIDDLRVDP